MSNTASTTCGEHKVEVRRKGDNMVITHIGETTIWGYFKDEPQPEPEGVYVEPGDEVQWFDKKDKRYYTAVLTSRPSDGPNIFLYTGVHRDNNKHWVFADPCDCHVVEYGQNVPVLGLKGRDDQGIQKGRVI